MTKAEMEAGTDTTGKLVSAKDLKDVYVNVDGDTMTGSLGIVKGNDGRWLYLRNTEKSSAVGIDVPSAGATNTFGDMVISDKDGAWVGQIATRKDSDDNVFTTVATSRYVNGTEQRNAVFLGIQADGTPTISFTGDAINAWKKGLGIVDKHYKVTELSFDLDNLSIAAVANTQATLPKTSGTLPAGATCTGTRYITCTNASSGGVGSQNCVITEVYINGETCQIKVKNNGTSAAKVRLRATVVYISMETDNQYT